MPPARPVGWDFLPARADLSPYQPRSRPRLSPKDTGGQTPATRAVTGTMDRLSSRSPTRWVFPCASPNLAGFTGGEKTGRAGGEWEGRTFPSGWACTRLSLSCLWTETPASLYPSCLFLVLFLIPFLSPVCFFKKEHSSLKTPI